MKKLTVLIVFLACWHNYSFADNPKAEIKTSMGTIVVELDKKNSPKSTANFIHYANEKFYEGTIFHRVIKDFMIQGGGFTFDLIQKPTQAPIENEAENGLKNLRGTIAMARTNIPHSATSQFFINVKDNDFIKFNAPSVTTIFFPRLGRSCRGIIIKSNLFVLKIDGRIRTIDLARLSLEII